MNDELRYPWQQAVVDAFLAPRDALAMKISIAERAIAARLQDSKQTELEERIALKDALNALKTLLAETGPRASRPDHRKREDIA